MSRRIDIKATLKPIKTSYSNRQAAVDAVIHQYNFKSLPNHVKASDYMFCRVRACSADQPNKNGDAFPYDELKQAYPTFIGKGVYTNHQADAVENMKGFIVDAAWREDRQHGAWVELLIAIDRANADLCRKIATGQITDVSMGCIVREGECSVCRNVCRGATNDYGQIIDMCEHVAQYKARTYNGMPVYENCRGVEFIEISAVTDGADPQALILEADIKTNAQVPDNVLQMYNRVAEDGSGAMKRAANSKVDYTDMPLYSVPDNVARKVFAACQQVEPLNYRTLFESMQTYSLGYVHTVLADKVDNRAAAIKGTIGRYAKASNHYRLTEDDVPTLQLLAEDYLDNYVPGNRHDQGLFNECVAYVMGKYQDELNQNTQLDPKGRNNYEIVDPEGFVTSIVNEMVTQKAAKALAPGRKGQTISKLEKLVSGQQVKISDVEYGFEDNLATIQAVMTSDPRGVNCVNVLVEVMGARKLATIFQADIDSEKTTLVTT